MSAGERVAVAKLLEVGEIFQALYQQQRHAQAREAFAALQALDRRLGSPEATGNLLTLYRRSSGPITRTLEGKREAFLPVDPLEPGRNVYPRGITRQEVEDWRRAHPEEADAILAPRTVVRRAQVENLRRDLGRLAAYPVLDALHPGLKPALESKLARADRNALYAVPYAVAYADEMVRSHRLMNEAADAVEKSDADFAIFLRNRSRDLLSNDYESGDAAWVAGRFQNLYAAIGAYESYDDDLFGAKTFFMLSLMRVRRKETDEVRQATRGLQALQQTLPHSQARERTVRTEISIGFYDVIADFGEARGINSATILPNESYLVRRHGRTIALRANLLDAPPIAEAQQRVWQAVVAPQHRADYTTRGEVEDTKWHEVGHYLGVDVTKGGQDVGSALQDSGGMLEELKADLVALHVAGVLHQQGHYSAGQLREVYAAGILRTMTEVRPLREDAHETMQLMQFNFFRQNGLISVDAVAMTIVHRLRPLSRDGQGHARSGPATAV